MSRGENTCSSLSLSRSCFCLSFQSSPSLLLLMSRSRDQRQRDRCCKDVADKRERGGAHTLPPAIVRIFASIFNHSSLETPCTVSPLLLPSLTHSLSQSIRRLIPFPFHSSLFSSERSCVSFSLRRSHTRYARKHERRLSQTDTLKV